MAVVWSSFFHDVASPLATKAQKQKLNNEDIVTLITAFEAIQAKSQVDIKLKEKLSKRITLIGQNFNPDDLYAVVYELGEILYPNEEELPKQVRHQLTSTSQQVETKTTKASYTPTDREIKETKSKEAEETDEFLHLFTGDERDQYIFFLSVFTLGNRSDTLNYVKNQIKSAKVKDIAYYRIAMAALEKKEFNKEIFDKETSEEEQIEYTFFQKVFASGNIYDTLNFVNNKVKSPKIKEKAYFKIAMALLEQELFVDAKTVLLRNKTSLTNCYPQALAIYDHAVLAKIKTALESKDYSSALMFCTHLLWTNKDRIIKKFPAEVRKNLIAQTKQDDCFKLDVESLIRAFLLIRNIEDPQVRDPQLAELAQAFFLCKESTSPERVVDLIQDESLKKTVWVWYSINQEKNGFNRTQVKKPSASQVPVHPLLLSVREPSSQQQMETKTKQAFSSTSEPDLLHSSSENLFDFDVSKIYILNALIGLMSFFKDRVNAQNYDSNEVKKTLLFLQKLLHILKVKYPKLVDKLTELENMISTILNCHVYLQFDSFVTTFVEIEPLLEAIEKFSTSQKEETVDDETQYTLFLDVFKTGNLNDALDFACIQIRSPKVKEKAYYKIAMAYVERGEFLYAKNILLPLKPEMPNLYSEGVVNFDNALCASIKTALQEKKYESVLNFCIHLIRADKDQFVKTFPVDIRESLLYKTGLGQDFSMKLSDLFKAFLLVRTMDDQPLKVSLLGKIILGLLRKEDFDLAKLVAERLPNSCLKPAILARISD